MNFARLSPKRHKQTLETPAFEKSGWVQSRLKPISWRDNMLIIRDNFARDGRIVTAAAGFSFCVTGSVVQAAYGSDPGVFPTATRTPASPETHVKKKKHAQL